ncbi:PXA domain protein 1 [Neolecta irregularis DAH-3]|uniref:PXA domain protein 1 n=1 Tax=Neolecta irregularis (strain DAH-3) TaxID=1198029 RepID=A0A1U7LQP1_NEOID|nr:PXA domain protein 1 [Neolecta irregularis DAH-3]|eukprot:OLL24949.1 PXA domain protein 1 [Neolecta irregularis DAH-3]
MEGGRNPQLMTSPNSILIRRVLCSSSAEESLPALTSSQKIDHELYVLISLILRDFVKKWYNEITHDDAIIGEIVSILAHVMRGLEERIRKVDLEAILLDDIPRILNTHILDYRTAASRFQYHNLTLEEYFHHLQPHVALESTESDLLYRTALSEGFLALLLPCEDFRSDCERLILREILGNIILGDALEKLAEPWMIWEIITKAIKAIQSEKPKISGNWVLRYHHLIPSISMVLSTVRNAALIVYSLVAPLNKPPTIPFSKTHLTTLIRTLFNLEEAESWILSQFRLAGSLFMASWMGHMVDNATSRLLRQCVFREGMVLVILEEARDALFPNNVLSPPRERPSQIEQIALRKEATETILSALPRKLLGQVDAFPHFLELIRQQLLGETLTMQRKTIEELLDCFSNKKINKYLAYALLDELLGKLVPEFLVDTIEDIVQVRLG